MLENLMQIMNTILVNEIYKTVLKRYLIAIDNT